MRPHSTKYWIGSCCGGGGVLVISKYVKSGNYVIMCDDCEAEWKSPELGDENRLPRDQETGEIKNATFEEIKALGWDKYVTGNSIDYECV